MEGVDLSIIVPVYNESSRLSKTFTELLNFLSIYQNLKVEIVFVNDGSVDKTGSMINDFILANPGQAKLIDNAVNHGKGYVVRQGMLNSSGRYCLMIDADMSTSMLEFEKFFPHVKNNKPIIIGTRTSADALLLKKQPWYRQNLGKLYTIIANLVTGLKIKDHTCGFKLFSRKVVSEIFSIAVIDRWAFDTEILYLAKKMKYPVVEVGVRWANDANSRMRLFRDAFLICMDLVRIITVHRKD